jgi:hypothetical protein
MSTLTRDSIFNYTARYQIFSLISSLIDRIVPSVFPILEIKIIIIIDVSQESVNCETVIYYNYLLEVDFYFVNNYISPYLIILSNFTRRWH